MDLIIKLERALHCPKTRKDKIKLKKLLHKDFQEVGASGTSYDFQSICFLLQSEQTESSNSEQIISQDFHATMLADNVCLLLYKSCLLSRDNVPHSFAKRSSVWQRTNGQWQIQYHQGTPCKAFPLHLKHQQ